MENSWIITIIVVSQIAWLWTLLAHLNNEECDPTDKILLDTRIGHSECLRDGITLHRWSERKR